jgi:hypothetical protein
MNEVINKKRRIEMDKVAGIIWKVAPNASIEFVDCEKLFRVYLPIPEEIKPGEGGMWLLGIDLIETELAKLGYLPRRSWEKGYCDFVMLDK